MKHLKKFEGFKESKDNIIEFKGNYYMFNNDTLKQDDNYINISDLSRNIGTVFYIDEDKDELGSNEFSINRLSKCRKLIASDNETLKGIEFKETEFFLNQ